jgi:hypothetical protein
VSLSDYSIDDLHAMATAELDGNADAIAQLHRLYKHLREQYIGTYKALREVRP